MGLKDLVFPKIPETLEEIESAIAQTEFWIRKLNEEIPHSSQTREYGQCAHNLRPMMKGLRNEKAEWLRRLTEARAARLAPALVPEICETPAEQEPAAAPTMAHAA
jgi:hypothetical protein